MSEIYYYMVMDRHPFVVIMKKDEDGWSWMDTILRNIYPSYYGKSKPKLDRDEHYVMTRDYKVAKQTIDRQIQEWKNEIMSDFYLNRDSREYLRNLSEWNREVFLQHYVSPKGKLVFMRTLLYKDRSWRQELGVFDEDSCRRSFHNNDLGSTEPMLFLRDDLRPIPIKEARQVAEVFAKKLIDKKMRIIEKFCEVREK